MSGVLGIREIGGCLQKETLVKLSSGHVNVNFLYGQPEARDFDRWVEISGMQGYTKQPDA
jgi:hypothetical protein